MKFTFLITVLFCAITFAADKNDPKTDESAEACAKVGESAGGSLLNRKQCCPGLTATMEMYNDPRVSCELPAMPGMGVTCIKCGDKKCDKKNNENRCSCPEDCK